MTNLGERDAKGATVKEEYNAERSFVRFEWLEGLLRVAHAKYVRWQKHDFGYALQLQLLLQHCQTLAKRDGPGAMPRVALPQNCCQAPHPRQSAACDARGQRLGIGRVQASCRILGGD